MAKSIQLSSFMHHPGVFYTDNPYVHPHEPLVSDNDDLSYAPFHCHIARDSKKDIENEVTAGHIIYGDSRPVILGRSGPNNVNKFNRITGHSKLFTSFEGPPRTKSHHDPEPKKDNDDPYFGNSLRLYSDNQTRNPHGVFFGRKTPDEIIIDDKDNQAAVDDFYNSQARWCSPLGVQFRWSSRGSNDSSSAINFVKIVLIYMDNWMPGRTLAMPLVDAYKGTGNNSDLYFGEFLNSRSYYRGSDPFTQTHQNESPGIGHTKYGEVVAYAEPEVVDYMAASYTRAVCVGMYLEFFPAYQGTLWDKVTEIFDFKFLFDMPDKNGNMMASNSMYIYPAPYPLKDAFDSNNIKLL